jgi:apolipoprotein N-acyltransferase
MIAADRSADGCAVRVALVQRNAPCCFKAGVRENPLEAFGRLIDAVAAVKPDIVVLAESAMSEFGDVRSFRAQDAAREFLARSGASALIAGGDDTVAGRTYNAAALYVADGEAGAGPVQVYHKQHLVPFGEYIPLDKIITPLQKLSPIGVSLYPGKPELFDLRLRNGRRVKIAPLICYEDTDPSLSARAAAMGADMIAVITNDSWFSNSSEAAAHASQAVMRALETGLPVVRVGNSGVTGVILGDGSARWLRGKDGRQLVDAPGVMVETVVVRSSEGIVR